MSWEVADPNAVVSVKATYDGVHQGPVKLGAAQTSYEFVFDIVVHPYWRQFAMKHFPALMGIFFILLAVALAFISNGTNPLQRQLLLGMFALGGGGFGGEIAGFIKADLTLGKKLVVSAGGAAAIFVLLFFFVPAGTLP